MSDFKKQADEEENKKLRFKGKFQEACQVNREGGWARVISWYEAGYESELHCSCHVCDHYRQENGLKRCVDRSCEGCKNLKSGNKIRNWSDLWSDTDARRKANDEN